MESSKRVLSTGETAVVLLRLVEASPDISPPLSPLKNAATATLHVIELVNGLKLSKKEWAAFGEYVAAATLCVVDAVQTSPVPEDGPENHVKQLKATLDAIAIELEVIKGRGILQRFLTHSKDAQRIEGFKHEVRKALDLFRLKVDDVIVKKLANLPNEKDMKRLLNEMVANFSEADDRQATPDGYLPFPVEKIRLRDAVERLPHLVDASWDREKACRKGTRVAIIEAIWSWIQQAETDQPAGICLLKEVAGSGKSALAHSVSARCDEEGVLFGTFFFDQLVETKARPTNLFSTLAYRLTKLGQDYTDALEQTLIKEPRLYSADQTQQFQRLILPAAKLAERSRVPKPIVIVIDGLNEGADETTLKILSKLVPRLPGTFRFFITSRPTPKVDYHLTTPAHVTHCSLDILGTNNLADLQQYIEWRLPEVAAYRGLGTDWVTSQLITDFANKAEGLFLWAATICDFLQDKHTFNPKATLHTLLYEKRDLGLPAEQKMARLFNRIMAQLVSVHVIAARSPFSPHPNEKLMVLQGLDVAS